MTRRIGFGTALVVVGVCGLAIRVAFVVLADPVVPAVGDAMAYHLLADHLADGFGYIRPFDLTEVGVVRPTAEYGPAWPGLLSLSSLLGVDSVTGHRLVATVVGTAGVIATGWAGRRLVDERVGLTAASVYALHPLVFQADATLMPEVLFGTLAAVLLGAAASERPDARWALGFGALGGVASLTRGEGVLLTALLAIAVVAGLPRADAARRLALVAAGGLLVLTPWTVRNAVEFGAFVPLTNNLATALDGANCDETYRGDNIGLWSYSPTCFEGFDQAELSRHGEADVAAEHRRDGFRYAAEHPTRVPLVVAARVLRTWGVFNASQTTFAAAAEGRVIGWERAGTALHVLVLLPLAGVAFVGRRRDLARSLVVLAMPLATVTATAALTYGNQRFRSGAEPALAVLAAIGVGVVADAAARRRAGVSGS